MDYKLNTWYVDKSKKSNWLLFVLKQDKGNYYFCRGINGLGKWIKGSRCLSGMVEATSEQIIKKITPYLEKQGFKGAFKFEGDGKLKFTHQGGGFKMHSHCKIILGDNRGMIYNPEKDKWGKIIQYLERPLTSDDCIPYISPAPSVKTYRNHNVRWYKVLKDTSHRDNFEPDRHVLKKNSIVWSVCIESSVLHPENNRWASNYPLKNFKIIENPYTNNKQLNSNTNGQTKENVLQSKTTTDRQSKRGVTVRLRRSTGKVTSGSRPTGNRTVIKHRKAKLGRCKISSSVISTSSTGCAN